MTYDTLTGMEAYAFDKVQEPWGGVTIDLHTVARIEDGIHAYAVSLRPSGRRVVTIPEDAPFAVFDRAFNAALSRYGASPYMGIWHDNDHHVIEFDPVEIVESKAEVDALAAIYPVSGGAYEFHTGLGYFPNGQS